MSGNGFSPFHQSRATVSDYASILLTETSLFAVCALCGSCLRFPKKSGESASPIGHRLYFCLSREQVPAANLVWTSGSLAPPSGRCCKIDFTCLFLFLLCGLHREFWAFPRQIIESASFHSSHVLRDRQVNTAIPRDSNKVCFPFRPNRVKVLLLYMLVPGTTLPH